MGYTKCDLMNMKIDQLRRLVDTHGLDVDKGVGGVCSRTKEDVVDDIYKELKKIERQRVSYFLFFSFLFFFSSLF